MIRARVIGEVWSTRKHPGLLNHKLLLVAPLGEQDGARVPTGEVVIALDTLDARIGQDVLVSWGSGARNVIAPGDNAGVLADAAVSVILDPRFDAS